MPGGVDAHLRPRIALSHPSAFGPTAERVSAWADDLRVRGMLREVQYATSYRDRPVGIRICHASCRSVFIADTHAVLTQLRQPARPSRQALVAAQVAAIAVAYTDSVEAGMSRLIDHVPATAPQPVPRPLFGEAVRLAQPSGDWAALRAVPTSTAVRRDAVLGQLHSGIRGRATVR
ncbi:lantibiotic dehydratase C-terminal domain-containing protein [Micromonospora saelicesensis]|uniref:lantibiotic dehydratase C-terminal domain-containing protein n=1 Tax=Micromonospora saelicesensis TaxID=285676 RepID=UPI0035A21CE0